MAGYIIFDCDYVCTYVKCYSYTQIYIYIYIYIYIFISQPFLKCLHTDCRQKVIQILFAFNLCGCRYLHIQQHENVA